MNLPKLYPFFFGLCLTISLPLSAQPQKRKPKKQLATTEAQTPQPKSEEVLELLRRAQHAAEQAQAEARLAREQNAQLQQRLAQNTEELARLRQTLTTFSTQIAALKIEAPAPAPTPQVTTPTAALEPVQRELETLQEQVEVNTAQLKEHAQTKVESDSKFRIKLHGMILANTYLNTRDSTLNDVPLFAPPPGNPIRKNNFGATLRQSRFGFTMEGPRLSQAWGAARVSAEAEFDFWGGENSEVLGSLRILTASARLDWDKTSVIVGQRPPLISPRNPSSLAAVWFSPFTVAGNLWQWRPQLMVEHRIGLSTSTELQLQGGMLLPFGESLQGEVIEGGPGYETRAVLSRTLASETKLEFGLGGYFHRRPFSFGRHVNSQALTSDWQVPLGSRLTFSGESYFGRAVNLSEASGFRNDRLYAVAGALSNPATRIRGVFTAGGWAQLNFKARPDLDFNLAYGQEDPRNRDLFFGQATATTRLKNQAATANFIWALRQNFLVSLEYRRLWTTYQTRQQQAGHYNLAVGYTF